MKYIKQIVVIAVFVSSFLGLQASVSQTVLAAGCLPQASTDSQATAQMECVARYIADCKEKDFGKEFCESLTVAQVNRCAADAQYKLKRQCVENVKANWTPPSDSDNGGLCDEGCTDIGSDFNPDDCAEGLTGECGVLDTIKLITKVLAAMAATVIVAMIIVGGIQYSMAGDESSKVQAAKQKIVNALIALLLLIFGFSLLQWLVPGGLI